MPDLDFLVVGTMYLFTVVAYSVKQYKLHKQLAIANLDPKNMGYLLKNAPNERYDTAIIVVSKEKATVQYGNSKRSNNSIRSQIYGLSSVVTAAETLPSKEDFLKREKQNLIEERKKLLLMEESLAKKEQAIIEMEVQQELDS